MEPKKASSARGNYVRLGKNADVIYNEADVIGRGQFGIVYRGLIPASGTVVAVKLLQNVPMVFTPTSEHASQHLRHADRHEGKGSHPAALSSAGPSSSSFAPPSKPRSPGCPSELAILYDVRADNCPNIVHVISTWNKVLKPPRSEASSAAAAAAPPLLSSSSSGESRPSRIFVMVTEYCEGGDLQQFMKARGGALPAHVARSFTYQLCNALLTLKRRRIVHRDVKPANLLLTSADCEVATLKLADFGMAKAAPAPESHKAGPASASGGKDTGREARNEEDEPADAFSPLFHSEMGTPMYMSPERLALQPYGYKADVYSAGMVLLEMMRGSCVQVKWESQLRSEVPRTIWRELRQYPPDEVPAWLDLVQRMTAADPAQRYSVEDVLRHSWFHAKVGPPLPPLPPLTFPLPETSEGGGERQPQETRLQAAATPAAGCTGSGSRSTEHADADSLTAAAVGVPGTGSDETAPGAPHRHNDPTVGAGGKGTSVPEPSASSSSDDGEAGEGTQQAIKVAAPSSKHRNSRPAEPSRWMVLGVCAEVDAVHNVANGAYTGPPKPALGAQDASPVTTTVSSAVTAEAFSLPPGCGPHIITNAVRSFVDVVYLYVLQDELDAARGLTLVSYLMELMQNGYAAYLKCLEYLGCSWRHTAAMNSCTLGGHRLVVREVNVLYGVWRQLMARLHGAQAAYTARLPSRILDSAAAWRQRLLGASATTGDQAAGADEDEGAPAALFVEEPREADVSDASTLSEGGMMMSALPSVTSISNVVADTEAAEGAGVPLLAAPPAPRIAEKLRVSSVCARAEQLIFEKAAECVQSEALSMLMDSTPPPVADDLGAMDCLEEEEAAVRVYQNRTTPSPPPGSEHLSAAADRSMPPHRGVALLRVLLRRAVLTISEVGLEEEGSRPARTPVVASATESLSYLVPPPPLNPMSVAAGSVSAEAVSKVVFVVKVPVFGTLDRTDLRTVENLLHAATRVFSSALSSTS